VSTQDEPLGPIAYLIAEFPGSNFTGEAFPILVDLVDRGLIRIIDLKFITRDLDGTVRGIELSDIQGQGVDLTIFEGASSGLLDDSDVTEAGSVLEPGSSAGVLVYENRWAAPFAQALRNSGAELISAGFIPLQSLVEALDAAEAADASS
jgi:hypothetical protein